MGNDGGSFSQRSEMVKMKKKQQKVKKHDAAKMKSGLCTLSKEPLKKSISMCRLGNLYNRETLIEKLVKKDMPKSGFGHINQLKDTRELNLDLTDNVIMCPIT